MKNSTLAENFSNHFEVVFAKTPELRKECYRIRHQVYSAELGWEPHDESRMERDGYDEFAYSFLLRHKRTGSFVGTIRLVLPPPKLPHVTLPFEDHCLDSMKLDVIDPARLERGTFGEASRLAVLEEFRKRAGEKTRSFALDDDSDDNEFSEEEKRNFPNIAVGLYLSIIAFAKMCNHELMFVLVEPRLQKRLKRVGLMFERAGENIEHHGTRALFFLRRSNFMSRFNEEMLGLFNLLESQLAEQMPLQPYLTRKAA